MNLVKVFLSIFLTIIIIDIGNAETKYIRAGANGDGSDWNNAYGNFTAAGLNNSTSSISRGNIYYVADGIYGSIKLANNESGSTYIYIKKATLSDHGTNSGWDASYGDGKADFSGIEFDSDYWEIDGQIGQWASDLPLYTKYGIRIQKNTTSKSQLIKIGESGAGNNNIVLKHIEAYYTNTPKTGNWGKGMDILYGWGKYWKVEYCWFHDAGRAPVLLIGTDNVIFDHCVIERNGQAQVAEGFSPSEHSEAFMAQTGSNDAELRFSYIRDWRSTGGVFLRPNNKSPYYPCERWKIYGNVFAQTGYWSVPSQANDGAGVINFKDGGQVSDIKIYNNTFVDLKYGARIMTASGTKSDSFIKNNLFYSANIYGNGSNLPVELGVAHSNNWYFDSGTHSETNLQYGIGDPFRNRAKKDYALLNSTNHGDDSVLVLSSESDVDLQGRYRGDDGVLDRGAFEFNLTEPNINPPQNPQNLRIVNSQN